MDIHPNENWDDPSSEGNVPPRNVPLNTLKQASQDSWDSSLASNSKRQNKVKIIGDSGFQARLNVGNTFNICAHEPIKVYCPCANKIDFMICQKCCTAFCSPLCLKETSNSSTVLESHSPSGKNSNLQQNVGHKNQMNDTNGKYSRQQVNDMNGKYSRQQVNDMNGKNPRQQVNDMTGKYPRQQTEVVERVSRNYQKPQAEIVETSPKPPISLPPPELMSVTLGETEFLPVVRKSIGRGKREVDSPSTCPPRSLQLDMSEFPQLEKAERPLTSVGRGRGRGVGSSFPSSVPGVTIKEQPSQSKSVVTLKQEDTPEDEIVSSKDLNFKQSTGLNNESEKLKEILKILNTPKDKVSESKLSLSEKEEGQIQAAISRSDVLGIGQEFEVFCTHVTEFGVIMFYPMWESPILDVLEVNLRELTDKVALKELISGRCCIAPFKGSSELYRAKIKSFPKAGLARVLYYDYGNEDDVKVTDLLEIPRYLNKIPNLVKPFKFDDFIPKSLSPQYVEKLKDYVEQKICILKFSSIDGRGCEGMPGNICAGRLIRLGKDIRAELIASGFGSVEFAESDDEELEKDDEEEEKNKPNNCQIALELPLHKNIPMKIVHVIDLENFYVVRAEDLPVVARIDSHLSRLASFTLDMLNLKNYTQAHPIIGCLAVTHNKWARCQIVSQVGKKCTVKYIDTGVVQEDIDVKELRELPKEFFDYHPCAYHCKLDIKPVSRDGKWEERLCETLRNLDKRKAGEHVDGGHLTLKCKSIENGVHVVELREMGGEDWSSQLVNSNLAMRIGDDKKEENKLTDESPSFHSEKIVKPKIRAQKSSVDDITNYPYIKNFLVKPRNLKNFVGQKFNVTAGTPTNRLYIVSTDNKNARLLEISDEISEYVGNATTFPVNKGPKVDDIILAIDKNSKHKKKYFRALVKATGIGDGIIEVLDIDSGTTCFAFAKDSRHINGEIVTIPVLGYDVMIDWVDTKKPMILDTDFNSFIKAKKHAIYLLEKVTEKMVVSLRDIKSNRLIEGQIKELGKWQWERIVEIGCYHEDDDVLSKGDWESMKGISAMDLPIQVNLDVLVVKVEISKKDKVAPYIMAKPLHPVVNQLEKVLDNQVEHYMKKVSSSNYFPAVSEMFFLLPPEGEVGGGKWQRCVKLEQRLNYFYCIDTGVSYVGEVRTGYMFRKMCPEFWKIPRLMVTTEFPNLEWDTKTHIGRRTRDAFLEIFKIGKIATLTYLPGNHEEVRYAHSMALSDRVAKILEEPYDDENND